MTASTRIDVRIDTLVLPANVGDERTVREAVHAALHVEVAQRLSDGLPTPAARSDIRVALRDPLPSNATTLGRLVASEVVRAVLT